MRAQYPPMLLPVLLVWCYWAAHRLKPHRAMGAGPSLAKVPAFEGSALVKFDPKFGQSNGFKFLTLEI